MILRQSVSILMFPFTLMKKGDHPAIGLDGFQMAEEAVWKPSRMNVEKDVFFAHIQSFLQKSVLGENGNLDNAAICDFLVYSCCDEMWNNRFFNPEWQYALKVKERSFRFSFFNDMKSFLSPKLVVYPDASVGTLMIPVQLKDENVEMKSLMDFNYHLQKLDKQRKSIFLHKPDSCQGGTQKEDRRQGFDKLQHLIRMNDEDGGFFLSDVVEALLSGLNEAFPCQLFTPRRCHVFSYFNVSQVEADRTVEEDWKEDLLRIARCQNSNYQVLSHSEAVRQTFQNIFIAVNVEGGAMMTVGDLDFHQGFMTNNLIQRYLWLYVLVFMQRYSLINMARGIGAIDNDGDRKNIVSLKRLRNLSDHLTRIKVNSYFSDVSDYTQHNEFYHFCCERLGVVRLLGDVEHKMQTLDDCLRQKVEQRNEFMQFLLTIFVIFLTLFSGINDGLQLFDSHFFSLAHNNVALWVGRLLFLSGIIGVVALFVARKRK